MLQRADFANKTRTAITHPVSFRRGYSLAEVAWKKQLAPNSIALNVMERDRGLHGKTYARRRTARVADTFSCTKQQVYQYMHEQLQAWLVTIK